MQIKIALLQIKAILNDQEANLRIGDQYCQRAAALDVDIALFPEMWNIGYSPCPKDPKGKTQWQSQAIGRNSPFVTHFKQLAKELEIAIALTYLEQCKGAPRNSVMLIDRHGNEVLTYAKIHTCDFGMDFALSPGEDFYVCTLDTKQGPLQVGAMICYDREFPESARILMLKGAELIITPNACELEEHRIEQFKTRAFENMVTLAMTNYPAPLQNGCSLCVDGVAFDEKGRSVPNLIYQAPETEGVFLSQLDITRLRHYRESETWGSAFRKPSCYQLLTSTKVEHPFIRREARR